MREKEREKEIRATPMQWMSVGKQEKKLTEDKRTNRDSRERQMKKGESERKKWMGENESKEKERKEMTERGRDEKLDK